MNASASPASAARRRRLRLLALASGLWALSALPALAQTTAVPASISYQGKVTDASGVLIGTGTPVNRDVIFRIYDGPTSTTVLYAERQNVTISNGEFSVLVGVGGAVGSEVKPALDTVFTGAQRYLGVTVDDGNAGADLEISPRQQIVTTPYAFRAKVAETLIGNALSSADMIANNTITGVKLADSTITSAKIANLSVISDDLADSSVTSAKIANGAIITEDLANGSVTAAKLGSDVGLWSVNGANLFRNSSVSVGTNNIQSGDRLTVSGGNIRLDFEKFLSFSSYPDNFTHNTKTMPVYGIGAFTDSGLGVNPALWLSGWEGIKFFTTNAPRMTINGGGWVGIGTTEPDDQLTVYSGNPEAAVRIQNTATGFGNQDGLRIGTNGSSNNFIHSWEPIPLFVTLGPSNPLNLYPDGRMGFNQTNGDGNVTAFFKSTGQAYIFVLVNRNGQGDYWFSEGGNAIKPGGGSWSALSDQRLKSDVTELTGSLDKLLRLRSVNFRYLDETRYGAGVQTGFIAQEVEKVFPQWVSEGPDGYKSIGTKGFESLTVQALRELRAEKDAQIAAAEKRAADAEARLAALEKQVAALVAAQR